MSVEKRPDAEPSERFLKFAEDVARFGESVEWTDRDSLISVLEESEQSLDFAKIEKALAFIKDIRPEIESKGTDTAKIFNQPTKIINPDRAELETVVEDRNQAAPKQIGRFKIERLLGKGGFAKVFLAFDPKLNRQVAVKVLEPSLFSNDDASARFDREAQAAAILSHPNIVPVFECGEIDKTRFIVSAFCDGITLADWAKAHEQPVESHRAASIVSKIAEAIAHAHQRGVVHRDLKPANVMLDTVDKKNLSGEDIDVTKLKVTDFGLAKYSESVDQLETTEGAIVGTPAFMSPEQASGSMDIGTGSDIYSLGVMLYKLVTGEFPILGDSHIKTLLAITTQEPKRPRKLNPAIPHDLEAICLKCLNKSPGDRYPSAHALSEDLSRFMNGEVVQARKASLPERLKKWCQRNPILTAAFLGISAAMAFALFQLRHASSENQRADRHLSMSQNVINKMTTDVVTNQKLPPTLRRTFAQNAADLQASLLAEAPDDRKILEKTVRANLRLARLLFDLNELETGLESLNNTISLIEPYEDEELFAHLKLEAINLKVGTMRVLEKDANEIAAEIDKATEEHQDSYKTAKLRFQSGMTFLRDSKFQEAIDEFDNSVAMYISADVEHSQSELGRVYRYKGEALMKLARLDESEEQTLLANGIFSAIPGHATEDYARCELQLARIYFANIKLAIKENEPYDGFVLKSRANFETCSRLFKKLINETPNVNRGYGQLALTYELWISMEAEFGEAQVAVDTVAKFAALWEIVPADVRERQIIGRILGESYLRAIKRLRSDGQEEQAVQQLELAKRLLEDLLAEYPGVEFIEELLAESEDLLNGSD